MEKMQEAMKSNLEWLTSSITKTKSSLPRLCHPNFDWQTPLLLSLPLPDPAASLTLCSYQTWAHPSLNPVLHCPASSGRGVTLGTEITFGSLFKGCSAFSSWPLPLLLENPHTFVVHRFPTFFKLKAFLPYSESNVNKLFYYLFLKYCTLESFKFPCT